MGSPKVQAGEVTFELHTLGWKAFQELCVSIVAESYGQTIESFHDSHDGGRDGAFYGRWHSEHDGNSEGSYTVQCKFFASAAKKLAPSDISQEMKKVSRLVSRGLADIYILFTNASLSGTTEERLRSSFKENCHVKDFRIYGRERISQIIRESKRLRKLVPQVYGLGDLSQILDERVYEQAKEILNSSTDTIRKFVATDAYAKGARALEEKGFVILLGGPGSGKSTIATELCLRAIDEDGYQIINARTADDFVKYSNPHEERQFFWIDDAFGSTQFELSNATSWNHAFPYLQGAINRGAKVLFTSRDYIFRQALAHLKTSAFPLIKDSQVTVNAEELTEKEREHILYNHIKLGAQTKGFKSAVKPYLHAIASHERFSPEIARRLGNPVFTQRLVLSSDGVNDFVERPIEFLKELINTIDSNSRSALGLLFMKGGSRESPVILSEADDKMITIFGCNEGEVRNALQALDGNLLILKPVNKGKEWQFKHPTIFEAFTDYVLDNPEFLDVYYLGAPIQAIMENISCGEHGKASKLIELPANRYDIIINRLIAEGGRRLFHRDLYSFLTNRCNKEFLTKYIQQDPNLLSIQRKVSSIGFQDYAVLLSKFHEFGLLLESKRKELVSELKENAVGIPDSCFLEYNIRGVLTESEMSGMKEAIRDRLLPIVDSRIDEWELEYQEDEDPESYFDGLINTLNDYREMLTDDAKAVSIIDEAQDRIYDIIDTLKTQYVEVQRRTMTELNEEAEHDGYHDPAAQNRSIFDDVDE